ncbi:hypothetical protein EDD16DRAFT_713276 [Pisolithus croceorrhizus]|nr:hypothetical protein EDD16DRAFT_713276 [Pisolithus croceorrhizus]
MRKHLESYSRSRSPFPWKGYCWQLLGRFEASALAANDILGGTQPHQTSMRRDSLRVIATDSEGHEFRVNDNVREIEGEVCPEAYVVVLGTNVTFRIGRDGCYIFISLSLHSSITVMYPKMEAFL